MSIDTLGELEHLVLLALIRLGPDAYGVPIVDELRKHVRRPIFRPSVYLALRRLEAKRLVRSRMGEAQARRGGRARRHFEPTALGLKAVRESQRTFARLSGGFVSEKKAGGQG